MKFSKLAASVVALASAFPLIAGQEVFVNEIHYDNVGTDTGEFIELAGPVDTDLTGWSLVLYNGANVNAAFVYDTTDLTGMMFRNPVDGIGFLPIKFPSNGIQNGARDAIALVDDSGNVVQFLSYEGVTTATSGPASGMTSVDIGIAEPPNTPVGSSLQLVGTGSTAADFVFAFGPIETPALENIGQTILIPSESPSAAPTDTMMSMMGKKGGATGGKKGGVLQ